MGTKVRKHTSYSIDHDGKEFEVEFQPCDWKEPIVKRLADGDWVVGYLCHDSDASNPLEDCDGCGNIIDGRRHNGQEHKYREVLGIDEYGNRYEDHEIDPMIVLLDVYSHGNEAWRVHGSGRYFPDERWDVSNCAGVWVPDECCRDHIHMKVTGELYGISITTETMEKKEHGKKKYWTEYHYTFQGRKSGRFKKPMDAIQAVFKREGLLFDTETYYKACAAEAVVCAGQAVETYNEWANGEVYGVIFQVYNRRRKPVGDVDACWGFVGSEYAEKELADGVDSIVKNAKELREEQRGKPVRLPSTGDLADGNVR